MKITKRIICACKIIAGKYETAYLIGNNINHVKRAVLDIYVRAELDAAVGGKINTKSAAARAEMMQSVLFDESVVLQSIHGGEPTVIYDCETEADFELLKSQDIETYNPCGHGDDNGNANL